MTDIKPPPRRVERRLTPAVGAVLLADISDSMNYRDSGGSGPRRIDRLAKVLDYILTRFRVQRLICFNDLPIEVELLGRVVLPEAGGSTALDVALEHVRGITPSPSRLIVISDGIPNHVERALQVARLLRPMVIDAYYVGPEAYDDGLRFMRQLAAAGAPGGQAGHFSLERPLLLGQEVERRLLLSRP